jgi:hypothetical protein
MVYNIYKGIVQSVNFVKFGTLRTFWALLWPFWQFCREVVWVWHSWIKAYLKVTRINHNWRLFWLGWKLCYCEVAIKFWRNIENASTHLPNVTCFQDKWKESGQWRKSSKNEKEKASKFGWRVFGITNTSFFSVTKI